MPVQAPEPVATLDPSGEVFCMVSVDDSICAALCPLGCRAKVFILLNPTTLF